MYLTLGLPSPASPQPRPVETDTIVRYNKDEFDRYVSYNYNCIDSVIQLII